MYIATFDLVPTNWYVWSSSSSYISRVLCSDLGGCSCIFLTQGRSSNLIWSVRGFLRLLSNFHWTLFSINWLLHAIFDLGGVFLASNSLHDLWGQKNHAHVYPYRNLRNFSEINFSIGPMVWPWIAVWVHIINKMYM